MTIVLMEGRFRPALDGSGKSFRAVEGNVQSAGRTLGPRTRALSPSNTQPEPTSVLVAC